MDNQIESNWALSVSRCGGVYFLKTVFLSGFYNDKAILDERCVVRDLVLLNILD